MSHPTEQTHTVVNRATAANLAWPLAVGAVVLLGIVSGGSSEANSAAFTLFRMVCIILLAAALLRLLSTRLALPERLGVVLFGLAVALIVLQLVPLPYSVFSELPGRDYVVTAVSVSAAAPRWMPMTLDPAATWACLLALMPPLAVFAATLTTVSRARWLIAGAILVGAITSALLGLAQRFQGPGSSLYFFEHVNFGLATGFFSNRNNFAMLMCIAIPLIWAITHRLSKQGRGNRIMVLATGAALMVTVFIGLAVSASRSGILLGMLVIALSTAMIWSPSSSRRSARARRSLLAILGAGLIVGQFGMIGILRIAETDPVIEYRTQISDVTLSAATHYLPIGSGFGTFRAVYGMHETPATILSAYVNHAHNDWLELWLEGGLPAAILLTAFVALFTWQAIRIWNPRGNYASHVLPRAASIGVLVLLLHSLVEYPLRMPALACVFAFLLGTTLGEPWQGKSTAKRRHRRTHDAPPEPTASATPATPPVFGLDGGDRWARLVPAKEVAT